MRRRVPERNAGGLPPEIAGGPWDWPGNDRRTAWQMAGRAWSEANLHNPNGWHRLLPEETRLRLRFDRYERLVRLAPGSPLYPLYVKYRAEWGSR